MFHNLHICFNESIMENIRYGNPNASDGEVIQAAKLANAHDFYCKVGKRIWKPV